MSEAEGGASAQPRTRRGLPVLPRSRRARLLAVLLGVAGLLAAACTALAMAARPVLLASLSSALGAEATIEGGVSARFGWAGPVVGFDRLRLKVSPARPDMADVRHAEVELPWSVLVGGRHIRAARLQGVTISFIRDGAGRSNWPALRRNGRAPSPWIGRLSVQDGTLDVADATLGLTFHGLLSTTPGPEGLATVEGEGRSPAGPWRARLQSPASPEQGRGRPVRLDLQLDAADGRSTATVDGRVSATSGGQFSGTVQASGPNLHEFSKLAHVPLPFTPRYSVRSGVSASTGRVVLDPLVAEVGASDVAGRLTISPHPNGRELGGELHTRSLRMSDLLAVAGGGQLSKGPPRPGRLLPDTPINLAPLRKLYGALRFDAASVRSPPAIRSLAMTVSFDGGRVRVEPLRLGLGGGHADARFVLDGRQAVPAIGLSLRLQGVTAAQLLASRQLPFNAPLQVDVALDGSGPSLAAAAGAASGRLQIALGSGQVGALQAAALTADLAQGLSGLFRHARQSVALRCARADFAVRQGIAQARTLRLVTDAGAASGTGALDFRNETVDLLFRPLPPAPQLTAVRLQGPLTHPRASLAPTGGARQLIGRALHVLARSPSELVKGAGSSAGTGCTG